WPFNGNANDESGNGNNGTVNGATLTTDRFGNANKAYSFDGNADNIIYSPINNAQEITISSWVFVESNGGGQMIIQNNNSNCTNVNFGSHFGYNQRINFSHNAVNCSNPGVDLLTESSVDTMNLVGRWVNLVCVINNLGNTYIFVDNVLKDSSISNLGYNFCSSINSSLRLGGPWWDQDLQWFNGKLDDIGIWNRALTECEIQDLYNAQLGSFSNTAVTVNPTNAVIGSNAILTVNSSVSNIQWQSNPSNVGWVNLANNTQYNGVTNDTLVVSNLQLSNHNQPFRVLACGDTSNVASIQIADTCITNVTIYDTLLTTVTDTLIINTTLSLPAPNNENTILIYPNPASDHITIDNGNYFAMAGYTIKIENNAGQQVFQSAVNQPQFYIDLSTWSGNGLYFVHLIDPQNNTVTVRKIVLQ
ncbi:MAG: LamG-like jellyroll fold domain-containing protein, partial [Crocinitomicaceae bacterium]